jgi:RNA polymerase sigma-70 factor, ECF subfamily
MFLLLLSQTRDGPKKFRAWQKKYFLKRDRNFLAGYCVYNTGSPESDMIEDSEMETAWNRSCEVWMTKEAAVEIQDPDAQLMLRFKSGDTDAFELLFAKHTRPVINFAYRFVRNREIAEDLAQEIFMRIFEGASGYEAQAKFTTWLYKIATHVCLNEIRKPHFKAKLHSAPAEVSEDHDSASFRNEIANESENRLERQAIANALKQALEQIPQKQRTAFFLNKYQELPYGEVAEVMNLSEKAVKSLIHRAKETLAAKLKPLLPELIKL